MSSLTLRKDPCELDFLALGALVHRLDPGVVPFRLTDVLLPALLNGRFGLPVGTDTSTSSPVSVR